MRPGYYKAAPMAILGEKDVKRHTSNCQKTQLLSFSDPHQLTYSPTCIRTFHLAFYLAFRVASYLTNILAFNSIWHVFWHTFWHSVRRFRSNSAHCNRTLTWRMRSNGAHCDRTLADEVQRCTAIGPLRLRSSGAHCDPELAERIGEKLREEDWQDTWRRGLARRRRRRRRRSRQLW